MLTTQHYTIIKEEALRITSLLIKKRKYKKDMFTLIDELLNPEFSEDKLLIKTLIPTYLARYYYFSIESIDPFCIRSFK